MLDREPLKRLDYMWWTQQGGWAFENCNIEMTFSSVYDSDVKSSNIVLCRLYRCVLIELLEQNKALQHLYMCVCPRARTRGSARAPPWPAALPPPLQAAPAPPFPLPCPARPATRTVPTVLSPVPPQLWRAGTAGLSVRSAHRLTKNSSNKQTLGKSYVGSPIEMKLLQHVIYFT